MSTHNFKIIIPGSLYVSKAGNDLSAGTDPAFPKATLSDYANPQTIGTGVYKNAFSLLQQNMSWNCDNYVVMDCISSVLWGSSSAGGGTRNINTNPLAGTLFARLNGFTWVNQVLNGTSNYNRVIFENGTFRNLTALTSTANLNNCTFANVTFDTSGNTNLNYCNLYNCSSTSTLNNITSIQNSYVDTGTVIHKTAWFGSPSTNFRNNNFRGAIIIGGVGYELKRNKAGASINPNPSYLDIDILEGGTGSVYARGNFNEDMDYLNIEKRGYNAVASTSPALKSDTTTIGNIGNSWYAVNYNTSDDAGATDMNVTISSGDLVLVAGQTTGYRETSAIQIGPIPQVIGRVNFRILRNFNSSVAKGSAENSNVTIVDNYPNGHSEGGHNPRRLTYLAMLSNSNNEPTSLEDWDNLGYAPSGTWIKFEQNTVPMVDASLVSKGNGEPLYNPTGAVNLMAKWIKFRIVLHNGIGPL